MTVEGKPTKVLLDQGAQSNLVTPKFVQDNRLPVGPLSQLVEGTFRLSGIGNIATNQIYGYTMLNIQVEGVATYREDSIALVVPDDSEFAKRVPIILGTCTTKRIVPHIKESEYEALEDVWHDTKVLEMLQARRAVVKAEMQEAVTNVPIYSGQVTAPKLNPGPAPEQIHPTRILRTSMGIDIPAFSSQIVEAELSWLPPVAEGVHKVLVEPLPCAQTPVHPAVRVQPCYNEIPKHGKKVPVFIVNRTGKDQKIPKGTPVAHAAEVTNLAEASKLKPTNPPEGSTKPQQSQEERQKKVFELLDLSHLQNWPPAEKQKAIDLMAEYSDIFALHELELGETKGTTHQIHLNDETPFKERYRHIPRHQLEEVRNMVEEMLRIGVIKESKSPWCNAVVLARKKDGGLRLCIDFRRLNQRTVKDSYPLPRIKESLDNIKGARFFTSLDLKQGFWEVPMDESSKQYTAFTVGPLGFYQFERMPFGLCNAPATFQRLMEACLGELVLETCLIYIDDIIVFAETENAHLARLRAVFDRIREYGLKMRPHKCTFFSPEVDYLGHHISVDGIRPDDRHIAKVKEFAPPATVTEVRRFLGFVNHYRRFIKGHSKVARPLQAYTSGENSKEKSAAVELSPEALQAFETLRDACITAPVLAFADYTKPFVLETDASKEALGAVLSQKQPDGTLRPVAFGSRTTTTGEKNYHSTKLEFLALKWAISDEFRDYLILNPFLVRTDNNPLTYIFTSPHLDAVGHRWVQQLAGFNFTIEYVKGKNNGAADGMSRIRRLSSDDTKAILNGAVQHPDERAETHRPEIAEFMEHLKAQGENPVLEDEEPETLLGPPTVVKLSTTQDCDLYIGRKMHDALGEGWEFSQSKWANPYRPENCRTRQECLDKYEAYVRSSPELMAALNELAGKRLGCWCHPLPCHGDVLVKLFKEQEASRPEGPSIRVMRPLRIQPPEWKVEQFNDPALMIIKHWLINKRARKTEDPDSKADLSRQLREHLPEDEANAYLRQAGNFKMKQGLLYHEGERQLDDARTPQFVVPKAYRKRALDGCHRDAGHQGQTRTLSLLQDRFWWPHMIMEAREAVRTCRRCQQATGSLEKAKLCPIVVTHPMELVHVDVLHVEKSPDDLRSGTRKILVVTDHFTRFTQAFVIDNEKARTIAHQLWNGFFSIFGAPARLISDQGRGFESQLIAELCKVLGVEKVRTSPYHPQGNGQVERANQTLLKMLTKLTEDEKKKWHLRLPTITHAYNCTRSAITGYSPYFLMFGTRPRTSVDLFFPTMREGPSSKNYRKYVQGLRCNLKEAFATAELAVAKEATRQKRYYDTKVRGVVLEEGDIVQLAVTGAHERRKIRDRWGDKLYSVTRVDPDVPVLEIQPMEGGNSFRVHRNRLRLLRQGTPLTACKTVRTSGDCDMCPCCSPASHNWEETEPPLTDLGGEASTVDEGSPGEISPGKNHLCTPEAESKWEQEPLEEPAEIQPYRSTNAGQGCPRDPPDSGQIEEVPDT